MIKYSIFEKIATGRFIQLCNINGHKKLRKHRTVE